MKKISQIMPFGLRVQPELLAWVKQKALDEQRSMNFIIGRILEKARAAEQGQEKSA